MTRCAERRSRAISSASSAGSPRSQPSDRITTTEPRPSRRPWTRFKVAIDAPMRVPPDQSTTAADARSSARSGSRRPSSCVIRVSRVPNTNASTRRCVDTAACRYWSSIRAYGAIEPDTSQTSTSFRGPCTCARQRRSSGSPPWRSDARTVAWRSGRTPRRRVWRVRRASRSGMCCARLMMIRRACARSTSVYAAKSLSCRSSTSLHAAGRTSDSPTLFGWASGGGGAATRGRTSSAPGGMPARSGPSGSPGSPKTAANAASKTGWSARREHRTARSARKTSRRWEASTARSARAAISSSPVPTRTPPARSSAASVARRSSTAPLARRASAGSAAPASDTFEHPQLPHPLEVLADLQRDAERVVERAVLAAERDERLRPRDRLPHAGQLVELDAAQPRDRVAHPLGDRLGDAGHPRADDLGLAVARRVVDPVVQAAALQRVVQLAGAVRGQDDDRPLTRADRLAELGDRHLEVGEDLEQEGLELVVGAVDLVDEQDDRPVVLERLEQRAPQEEAAGEKPAPVPPPPPRTQREELARGVPVVERLVDVDALVALQADEPRAGRRGERLGDLGLPHARLALHEQRLAELGGEEDRGGQRAVGEVALLGERLADRVR